VDIVTVASGRKIRLNQRDNSAILNKYPQPAAILIEQ
jgi:hypothetical protein